MKKLLLLIPILTLMIPQTLFALEPIYQVPDPYETPECEDFMSNYVEALGYTPDSTDIEFYNGECEFIYEDLRDNGNFPEIGEYYRDLFQAITVETSSNSDNILFEQHIRYLGLTYYELLVREDLLSFTDTDQIYQDGFNDGLADVELESAIVSTDNENIVVTLTNDEDYILTTQYSTIKNFERELADNFNLTSFIPQLLSLVFGFFFTIMDFEIMGVSLLSFIQVLIGFILVYVVFRMLYSGK